LEKPVYQSSAVLTFIVLKWQKNKQKKENKNSEKQSRQTVIREIKTRGDKFFFSTFSTDIRRPV